MFKISIRLIHIMIMGSLFFPGKAMADDSVLPSSVFTAIMLKALSYDRNVDRQAKDKLMVGIISASDDDTAQVFSTQVKEEIAKVQSSFLLKGKPVDSEILVLDKTFNRAKFEEQLKKENISVLVVALNDAASINKIIDVSRPLQVNSVCEIPDCAKNGIGLEIIQSDGKPKMISNLDALKQEGSDYNSKFLAMCQDVK